MSPAEAHKLVSTFLRDGLLEPELMSDGDALAMLDLLQRRYNSLAVRQAAS